MTDTHEFPRLMMGVIPYLTVDGADAASAFYQRAFGAIPHGEPVRGPDGRVMNIQLEIHGGMLMLADAFPEHGGPSAPTDGRVPVTMQLVVRDGPGWWQRALDAGCTVQTPYAPAFWGGSYGTVVDPSGYAWAIHEPASS